MSLPSPKSLRIACILVLSCAASVRAQDTAGTLWPMRPGNRWTAESESKGTKATLVMTVRSVRQDGAATEAILDYTMGGTVVQTEVYRLDATGLTRSKGGKEGADAIVPPFPVLRHPVTPGSTWSWKGSLILGGTTFQGVADFKANPPETIATPAGKFLATRVRVDLTVLDGHGGQASFTNDYWFAPGVGLVQQDFRLGETTLSTSTVTGYQLEQ